MAQQVKRRLLVSAQVMISWFMGLRPMSGSSLTVRGLLGVLSLHLSAPPPFMHMHALSLSLSKYTDFKKKGRKKGKESGIVFFFRERERERERECVCVCTRMRAQGAPLVQGGGRAEGEETKES